MKTIANKFFKALNILVAKLEAKTAPEKVVNIDEKAHGFYLNRFSEDIKIVESTDNIPYEVSISKKAFESISNMFSIEKYLDFLLEKFHTWKNISSNKEIYFNDEFVICYKENFIWNDFSLICPLTENIVYNCSDKLNWSLITNLRILTNEEFTNCKKFLNLKELSLGSISKLSEEIRNENINEFDFNKLSILEHSADFLDKYQSQLNWDYISVSQELTEDTIYKFKHKLNWVKLVITQNMSEEFIDKMAAYINFSFLVNRKFSQTFYEKWEAKFEQDKLNRPQTW